MAEIVQIPVSDLMLDHENPRLLGNRTSQQDTALGLTQQQGDNIVRLAADIINHGLDPTALLAVVPTGDRRKRYRVLEGNRRLLAVRALDTPSLISPALSASSNRRLLDLADKFARNPIALLPCALFATENDATHWLQLRHTGQNQGVGLVEWGAEEKDRFTSRHAGARKPAGQLLDFVEKRGALSAEGQASTQRILTNVERLLGSPYVRDKLGLDIVRGEVVAYYPLEEIVGAISRVVNDLKTGKVSVPDLYKSKDRENYINSLPRSLLAKASKRLSEPIVLNDLTSGTKAPRKVGVTAGVPRKPVVLRTTVIPKTAQLEVTVPRINAIYNELLTLNSEQFPNACSVLLRVFLELSVDHVIEQRKLMSSERMRNTPLAKRLKTVALDLEKSGAIPTKLRAAIEKIADGRSVLAPTLPTFNQYVHNEYVFPRASDLYSTWDEVSPMLEKLWR